MDDSRAQLVLTNEIYQQKLKYIDFAMDVLAIDRVGFQGELSLQVNTNPITKTKSTNLVYVIYTSGTSGNPKGVMQPHSNVVRLFTATEDWFKFNSNDVWTLFHSYVFDFSVWEMRGALLYGGKLLVPSYEQTRDFIAFYDLCKAENVTVLNQTPTAFYQFIDISINNGLQNTLPKLRYIIFGGEALNFSQLKAWFDMYGYNKPRLINMYGITETTVHTTYKLIRKKDLQRGSCIGVLIPDLKAYILDRGLDPLPIGATGELHIGEAGLARGYLNKPDLTAERFIQNPFQTEEERRQNKNGSLYKTGDLVRRLPDGDLEYIGRNDFQVKIRGFRIETREVENAILRLPGIKQVVVQDRERQTEFGSVKYLVAYYICNINIKDTLTTESIVAYLSKTLPVHMIPTVFVELNSFPLTINGKLDRKALPDPEFISTEGYVAPNNGSEQQLCNIWQGVLGLERVGITDDFFRIGGDSILSILLSSKMRKAGLIFSVNPYISPSII